MSIVPLKGVKSLSKRVYETGALFITPSKYRGPMANITVAGGLNCLLETIPPSANLGVFSLSKGAGYKKDCISSTSGKIPRASTLDKE